MPPRKAKRGNANKPANIWDIAQLPLAPRGSVKTTQAEMYEGVKSVVDKFLALRSCDCALLAYGATGSGKTFSMQGPKRAYLKAVDGVAPNTVDDKEGLLQRCLQHIFTRPSDNCTISVCAVEIYKEKIRDLLVSGARWDDPACECEILSLQNVADNKKCNTADIKMMGQAQLRHKDKSKLRELKVDGVHKAMHALSDALQSRTCRETKKNSESSRSHMLIGISLCAPPLQAQLDGRETQEVSKTATLWLGDLCGAEAYDQGASAQQLAETRSINQSLLSFTSCLQTLWRNQQQGERGVPPVRDSALTRVLVDIMRGVGHLALSVHFSLRDADVESTRRTLKFAEQVAELRFEAGLRMQQRVQLDGDEAPPEQGGFPDPGASVPDERRAVAERQARDRQRLLEYPELLRQRDRLQQEIVQLKEAAVEREGAAYEEGVQAGREEAEEKHESGEADAELLELANQDWGQRLEEAVHEAKQKMHEQMCAHVEEVTQRAYERESKLNASVAELRGKLRRAGLLENQPRMQRRTLVRASRQQGGDSSGGDSGSGDEAAARPSTVEEEEEGATDEGPAESGDGASEPGSSDGDSDERKARARVAAAGPLPEEFDSDAPVGAVQSQRGGSPEGSASEVAGAHREGSVSPGAGRGSAGGSDLPGKDFATETETLRREMKTVARWRKVQDALEVERRRSETLEAEVSALQEKMLGLQQENSAQQAGPGEPEGAGQKPDAPACEPAPGGGGLALPCPDPGLQASEVEPSVDEQAQDTRKAIEADLADDCSEHEDDASPEAELSELRYAAILKEALADATDSDGDGEHGSGDDADPAPVVAQALDAVGATSDGGDAAAAAAAEAGAEHAADDVPVIFDIIEISSVAVPPEAVCEEPSLDAVNVSIAPPLEAPAAELEAPPPQRACSAEACSSDDGVAVSEKQVEDLLAEVERACNAPLGGGLPAQSPAAGAADNTAAAATEEAAEPEQPAPKAAPLVHRTTLQSLLAAVPLPRMDAGLVDVLPDTGRRLEAAEDQPARTRRGARGGRGRPRSGRAAAAVAAVVEKRPGEVSQENPGDENKGQQVGKKGRARPLRNNRAGDNAPVTRALRNRRN